MGREPGAGRLLVTHSDAAVLDTATGRLTTSRVRARPIGFLPDGRIAALRMTDHGTQLGSRELGYSCAMGWGALAVALPASAAAAHLTRDPGPRSA